METQTFSFQTSGSNATLFAYVCIHNNMGNDRKLGNDRIHLFSSKYVQYFTILFYKFKFDIAIFKNRANYTNYLQKYQLRTRTLKVHASFYQFWYTRIRMKIVEDRRTREVFGFSLAYLIHWNRGTMICKTAGKNTNRCLVSQTLIANDDIENFRLERFFRRKIRF